MPSKHYIFNKDMSVSKVATDQSFDCLPTLPSDYTFALPAYLCLNAFKQSSTIRGLCASWYCGDVSDLLKRANKRQLQKYVNRALAEIAFTDGHHIVILVRDRVSSFSV